MFLILLLCIFAVNTSLTNPERRIIGGHEVDIKEYPYMAFIFFNAPGTSLFSTCGGTILNPTHILTALHCVRYCLPNIFTGNEDCWKVPADQLYVILGASKPANDDTRHGVKRVHIHPEIQNFGEEQKCYTDLDVAVLVLSTALQFSDKISATKLPEYVALEDLSSSKTNAFMSENKICKAVGFGRLIQHPKFDVISNLHVANVPLQTVKACIQYTYGLLSPSEAQAGMIPGEYCPYTHVCSHDPKNETGICQGDSGGPIVCDGVQIGVSSFMVQNCTGYNAYTRTDIIARWIEDIVNLNNEPNTFHTTNRLLCVLSYVITIFM